MSLLKVAWLTERAPVPASSPLSTAPPSVPAVSWSNTVAAPETVSVPVPPLSPLSTAPPSAPAESDVNTQFVAVTLPVPVVAVVPPE